MKKLVDDYELHNESEYYELITDSYTNGQFKQAKEQFKKMPEENRREYITDLEYNQVDYKMHGFFCEMLTA